MGRCWLLLLLVIGLTGCGGGGSENRDIGPGGSRPDLSDIEVYAADSPYREVLKACATASAPENLCSMETLPLLGQSVASPMAEDIMGRVLVSHPWMGDRFRQLLEQLPADIRLLMKGVTAIVIDSDIRPSFYSSNTAAIYLDPKDLWLTNEEKATISRAADPRSGYGDGLQFEAFWRYVSQNDYAYGSYSLAGSETRQLDDILLPMARLLYHELAHANDLLPPALAAGLDPQWTPRSAIQALASESASAKLAAFRPLTSEVWSQLAGVLFFGHSLTVDLSGMTAESVGTEFAADAASDAYGYATVREDVAMLFEETMMKYHFDIDRDLAFVARPAEDTDICSDYPVKWGVRNRVGAAGVTERAILVAGQLLPDEDLSGFLAALPAPTMMTVDLDWCQNLLLGPEGPQPLAFPPPAGMRLREVDRLPPD